MNKKVKDLKVGDCFQLDPGGSVYKVTDLNDDGVKVDGKLVCSHKGGWDRDWILIDGDTEIIPVNIEDHKDHIGFIAA